MKRAEEDGGVKCADTFLCRSADVLQLAREDRALRLDLRLGSTPAGSEVSLQRGYRASRDKS